MLRAMPTSSRFRHFVSVLPCISNEFSRIAVFTSGTMSCGRDISHRWCLVLATIVFDMTLRSLDAVHIRAKLMRWVRPESPRMAEPECSAAMSAEQPAEVRLLKGAALALLPLRTEGSAVCEARIWDSKGPHLKSDAFEGFTGGLPGVRHTRLKTAQANLFAHPPSISIALELRLCAARSADVCVGDLGRAIPPISDESGPGDNLSKACSHRQVGLPAMLEPLGRRRRCAASHAAPSVRGNGCPGADSVRRDGRRCLTWCRICNFSVRPTHGLLSFRLKFKGKPSYVQRYSALLLTSWLNHFPDDCDATPT